jgi:hypothetical protein
MPLSEKNLGSWTFDKTLAALKGIKNLKSTNPEAKILKDVIANMNQIGASR